MRKSYLIAALAGSLAVGMVAAQQNNSAPAQLPAGTAPKQLNDQDDIRHVLGTAANAGVTKDAFDDLTERLSTADRKRMKEFADKKYPPLNDQIEHLRTSWKAKYGQDINLTDKQMLNTFLIVLEGEVTDPAVAKMHWPVRVVTPKADEPIQAGDAASSAEYLEKGRNVAIVTVPSGSGTMPNLFLSMIHESIDDWRIDIPDTITAQQIYDNLLANLTKFSERMDAWPPNVGDASRQLAYAVFSAITNVPPRQGSQASAR